jgi:hypothetical protein
MLEEINILLRLRDFSEEDEEQDIVNEYKIISFFIFLFILYTSL